MSDTTASTDALRAALESSDGFQVLAQALPDAVFVVRSDGVVTYASVLSADYVGRPAGDIVGRPFLDLVAEDDRAVFPPAPFEASVGMWDFRPARPEGGAADRWLTAALLSTRLSGFRGTRIGDALGDGALVLLRNAPLRGLPPGSFQGGPSRDGGPGDRELVPARDRVDLLRRALDATNNLVVMTDARAEDNPLVFVNDHFLETTGYAREDVIGHNCRLLQTRPDGTRDDDQDGVRELARAVAAGEPTQVILRNYTKGGRLFFNELYLTPIPDRSGQVAYFVGVQNDVTDRVLAEREALSRGALLGAFFDSAPVLMGVVQRDAAGLVHRTANEAAAELFGRPAPQVAGARPHELGFSEREGRRWAAAVEECATSGGAVEFETRFPWDAEPNVEGVRLFRVVIARVEGQGTAVQGELYSYLGEDVTLARQGEAERRLLAAAVDQAADSILVTTAEVGEPGPTIVYANRAHTRMFGYDEDEVLGSTPRMYQGPKTERAVLDRIRQRLEAGEPVRAETINYRKDGSEFVLEWEIAPVRGADGRVQNWVGTQRDVTERRQLERGILEVQAREQERMAQDLHDGLGQVLSGAAFMVEGVRAELERRGDADLADRLSRAADHVQAGHQQARAIARGLFPVNIEPDGLMVALERLASDAAEAYGVTCTFAFDAPVIVASHDHAGHLYRIAQEAVANAVRHGRAEVVGVTLMRVGDGRVQLSVEDDGLGISAEALTGEGGLGLRTMRYRAERVGGDLEVRPLEDGGTLVAVRFEPAAPDGES